MGTWSDKMGVFLFDLLTALEVNIQYISKNNESSIVMIHKKPVI